MGIQGLLPLLKSTTTPVHIKDYAGKVAAVDTYSWLHKGAITCSKELCHGIPTTKFIDYCMHRINLLCQHGVKPLLVFDGGCLPMKEEQEKKRARSRKVNLEKALEHEQGGNHAAAYDCYQKAVDITPQIAFQLIKTLQHEKIDYIVAPYEADAQMAFLSINGLVDIVITEDSDMIPFGCLKVMFKMDKYGQGVEFQYDDLVKNRDLNFTSFTKQMLTEMCILSGCDYLPSLPGMGVKRAHGLIRRFRNYHKVIKHLRYNGVSIPPCYEDMFTKAIMTFRHQWVYDPIQEAIVNLTPLSAEFTSDLDFLGPTLSKYLGQAIAKGEVDPITRRPFEPVASQDQVISKLMPLKERNLNGSRKRQLDLPIQKNLLTHYFMSASTEAKRQFKAPRNKESPEELIDEVTLEAGKDFQRFNLMKSPGFVDTRGPTSLSERCSSDLSFFAEEDQVLAFLNSKMNSQPDAAAADSLDTEVLGCGLATSSRERTSCYRDSYQGNCVTKSVYFSKSRLSKRISDPVGKHNVLHDLELENFESSSPVGNVYSNSQGTAEKDSQIRSNKAADAGSSACSNPRIVKKSVDWISAGEKKHIPAFSSKLVADSVQPGNFASDTSHIEQYACIAQKSIERFVSAIAPFRCSGPGARASGLRRPVKSMLSGKTCRSSSKLEKSAEDLKKYAYTPSNCRSALS